MGQGEDTPPPPDRRPVRRVAKKAPVRKVIAATGGAGIGAATSDLIIWALDGTMFDASKADSVPTAVTTWIAIVTPALCGFIAGYLTPRSADE